MGGNLERKSLGTHTFIELWGCSQEVNNTESIRMALTRSVDAAGATLIELNVHQFSPYGVTGVALLAESHMSLHSWPEHGYLAADIFTCGTTCQAEKIVAVLQEIFKPELIEVQTIQRGILPETPFATQETDFQQQGSPCQSISTISKMS